MGLDRLEGFNEKVGWDTSNRGDYGRETINKHGQRASSIGSMSGAPQQSFDGNIEPEDDIPNLTPFNISKEAIAKDGKI